MATLSANVSGRTVNWHIASLGYPFDDRQYISAGVCLVPFSDGSASISGVVDMASPVTFVPATPPTYGSRLYDQGVPVQVWVAQSGYTSYTFNSSSGIYSYSGSYVTLQPSQSGTLYTISGGGTFLERQVMSGGYQTVYWYESYVVDPGSPAVVGEYDINDSFIDADYGTYTIYGWAKLQVNNLYYNAGSYSITVLGDGAATIKISDIWNKAYPYIRINGVWIPTQAYMRSGDIWSMCV